ncbi:hypothetical protein HN695_05835 [Candidatus Woesearchaeota archaeon]|jgi:glutaredoxin|nr:hypothetical protein [Candidatus Woesearchaeota archaeon]MBT5272598.1 hypothetical protein [Candidatus Woesearchaeota archaeon]MBT6040545.1 hypothetical protein [Candidatus Woesearchaeota archaeon]MBT6337150.1 hypothetical protein [Candidatus Woesearchaeota archaeon]MBT7927830.1 hypothetical protein [Candidatus Woesearchaeota archaeon]
MKKMFKRGISLNDILVPAVLIIVIIGLVSAYSLVKMPGGGSDYDGEQVKLDFYVMSQCPYGTQVEDAVKPVLDQLGGAVDFNLEFIVTETAPGQFQSLHGTPEVLGNIAQLCAAEYYPDKYMDMVVCMNANAQAIPGNWNACAKSSELDVAKIEACYDGDEGKELLSESAKKATAVSARGSPTIFLNDQPYAGGRTENDFLRAICNAFESDKPEACNDIPEPTKVNLIMLNDKRCAECQAATGVVSQLKGIFPGLEVTALDYMSEEGKELFETAGVKVLPAFLFDQAVKEGEGYAAVQQYLVPQGEYLSLMVGASFDPIKEICNNEIDDTGNGNIDCDDDSCKEDFVCREEEKGNLQLFIMSDCPYGRKGVEALKGVVDNLGDAVDYEVHYIANEVQDGFDSLHGQYEVDENIIQLCVKEHSPDAWLDYLYCRSTNGVKGVNWKTCAEEFSVDVTAVETCFDGEQGAELLSEDIKIANGLGIGASPTWIANNQNKFSGIDAATVQTNFCQYNDVEGCDTEVAASTTPNVPAGACS